MRYEQKAELQDSNKARMYEEKEKQQSLRLKEFDEQQKKDKLKYIKKKQDKLKKYSVTVSKTISVLASDEYEAEEIAINDFDCTDLDCEVNDE